MSEELNDIDVLMDLDPLSLTITDPNAVAKLILYYRTMREGGLRVAKKDKKAEGPKINLEALGLVETKVYVPVKRRV